MDRRIWGIIACIVALAIAFAFGYLQLVLGLVLALFIPGFLLSKIIVPTMNWVERATASVMLSFAILVLLGFMLTLYGYATGRKGITITNVYVSLLVISLIQGIIVGGKN